MSSKQSGYDFWRNVLNSPKYIAAPMVDMSELSFRELCRRYNAHLCFTPMLHSQQFVQDSLYRHDSFTTSAEDRPLIVQFCANDPEVFVEAGSMVASQCDAIDLNLGCPQAIAKKGHYGAFLQDKWDLIRSMLQKASNELSVPVTCKMRILPGSSLRSVEYAKMLEDSGCSVLTVHGRTRYQKGHNTGLASWDTIRDIKQSVHIPVIANGNILTFDDVQSCLKYTGADAVMSAESLLNNPALFTGKNPPVWEMAEEYLTIAQNHSTPVRNVRNHMYRLLYLCLHQDNKLRADLEDASTFEDFYNICRNLETLPLKIVGSDMSHHVSDSSDEKTLEDLHIAHLFSPRALISENDNFNFKNCVDLSTENNYDLDYVAISENLCSVYQLLEGEVNEQELKKPDMFSDEQSYLPVWLCHSRPRISASGSRGCYSKYFTASAENSANEQEIYLSKRQQRKARHYTRVLAAKKENRKTKKLRRKLKLLEIKENSCFELKSKTGDRISRKETKCAIRQRLLAAQGTAPRICIDLGFSSEMNSKELNRLSTQLRRLYGSNRQTAKPVHLYFCNFSKSDPLYEICVAKNDGFSSYVVDMVELSPEEQFLPDEIVYLSPDSENVLNSLDESKVYVIGGIVDGSVKKGLTLSHAANMEIQTARLPIAEKLIRQGCGNSVLTVNQVFDILLKFYETGDWVQSLTAGIPARKGFRAPKAETDQLSPDEDAISRPTTEMPM